MTVAAITRLPARGHRVMAWANGGGETAEVAIAPAGASIAARDFDWRISMARVAADGPFSALAGYDRHLTLIAGGGMTLDAGAHGRLVLARPFASATFPGDWPVEGRLHDGPIDDLNVMTRRGRATAAVEIRMVEGDGTLDLDAATTLVVALAGRVRACSKMGGGRADDPAHLALPAPIPAPAGPPTATAGSGTADAVWRLGPRDALRADGRARLALDGSGVVAVIGIAQVA
jgi:environmental stress-induced protein Ves